MGRDRRSLTELALLFLRLGTTAFGGPPAHIAMMHAEVVRRREWVDEQRFVDLIGATNLIPGPNSTELAIHLGHDREGWRGLVAAGACFILPAALMVGGLAWAYVRYQQTPAVEGLLRGVTPVVVAIIAQALLRLGRTVLRGRLAALVFAGATAAYLLGVSVLATLGAGALLAVAVRTAPWRRLPRISGGAALLPLAWTAQPHFTDPGGGQLARLFLTTLKIGAVLYGSGYVLVAFLRDNFVNHLGWLTESQLLDAVAIGQLTPGPVFTTATFAGYVVAGLPGAVLATVAIFLPSFVFVAALTRVTAWLRSAAWSAAALDGVNAAALGLMAGVSYQLARDAVVDPVSAGLFLVAALLLWRTRLNSAWLVLGGLAAGATRVLAGLAG